MSRTMSRATLSEVFSARSTAAVEPTEMQPRASRTAMAGRSTGPRSRLRVRRSVRATGENLPARLDASGDVAPRHVAIDPRLGGQREDALAEDVALDLVGAAGDAVAGRAEHVGRPRVRAPFAGVG